ncbi:MAG: hypothetical protein KME26_24190 [Oscillatoria princeps RMCB-10]|nr:hypothetical protein [Oscillatoria princeps RMCB-10]
MPADIVLNLLHVVNQVAVTLENLPQGIVEVEFSPTVWRWVGVVAGEDC